MKNLSKFLYSLLPLAAIGAISLFYSCADPIPGDDPGSDPPSYEGEGVLATSIKPLDTKSTRADDGTSPALPTENRVVSARVILFDNNLEIASLADCKNIEYSGSGWTWEFDAGTYIAPNNTIACNFEITGDEFDPVISFYWTNLPVDSYFLFVVLNPQGTSPGEMLDYYGPDGGNTLFAMLGDNTGTNAYKLLVPDYNFTTRSNPVNLFTPAVFNQYDPAVDGSYTFADIAYDRISNAFCGGITSPFVNLSPNAASGNLTGPADIADKLKMVMMNADGLVEVNPTHFHESIDKALSNPLSVNVERAVAKVAVFNETGMQLTQSTNWAGMPDDFYELSNGARIWKNIYWTTDIISMTPFLMRVPANLAPNAPDNGTYGSEIPSSPRKYRYAEKSYKYASWQYELDHGMTEEEIEEDHEQYPDDYPRPETYFLSQRYMRTGPDKERWWNNMPASTSPDGWETWEYVTENTMDASNQYGDITTSVMLMAYYIPSDDSYIVNSELPTGYTDLSGQDQQIIPEDETASYYMFNGLALAKDVLARLYDTYFGYGLTQRPVPTDGDLAPLQGLDMAFDMIAERYRKWYNRKNSSDPTGDFLKAEHVFTDWFCNPVAGPLSYSGLNYYPGCLHSYPIPIPHFDSSLSPEFMGYGRYGVVRNNVYKISVTGINGPGRPANLPFDGMVDNRAGSNVNMNFKVEPWDIKTLNYDL